MQNQGIRRVITIAVAIVVISLLVALGYRYYYQPTYDFVETDDAQVTGNLARVGAPAGGRVDALLMNVGDAVHANDTLATIQVIAAGNPVAVGPSVSRVLARITSPITGTVAARWVSVGDTVAPGQPLYTIADLKNLWVIVNVGEDRIAQIEPGQNADVNISALGVILRGTVAQIGSATTEVINPSANVLGSTDSTKKIPVRIAVEWGNAQAMPGLTADVTIYVRAKQESQ